MERQMIPLVSECGTPSIATCEIGGKPNSTRVFTKLYRRMFANGVAEATEFACKMFELEDQVESKLGL